MDEGFNSQQSQPKRKKRCKVGYPCKECVYVATRASNFKNPY